MPELTPLQEKMADISEGNPGAISVLVQLQYAAELIEYLHEHGPRGSALWMLYKDECGEDAWKLGELLAARASEFRL